MKLFLLFFLLVEKVVEANNRKKKKKKTTSRTKNEHIRYSNSNKLSSGSLYPAVPSAPAEKRSAPIVPPLPEAQQQEKQPEIAAKSVGDTAEGLFWKSYQHGEPGTSC